MSSKAITPKWTQGEKWYPAEDEKLKSLIAEKSVREIAGILRRKPMDIESRIKELNLASTIDKNQKDVVVIPASTINSYKKRAEALPDPGEQNVKIINLLVRYDEKYNELLERQQGFEKQQQGFEKQIALLKSTADETNKMVKESYDFWKNKRGSSKP